MDLKLINEQGETNESLSGGKIVLSTEESNTTSSVFQGIIENLLSPPGVSGRDATELIISNSSILQKHGLHRPVENITTESSRLSFTHNESAPSSTVVSPNTTSTFTEVAISHRVSLPSSRVITNRNTFTVTVLTMNRVKSLQRLLLSLEASEYGDDKINLVVKVDHSSSNQGVLDFAKYFNFSHGPKLIEVADRNKGLRQSWFEAWTPLHEQDFGVILEDDSEVSPKWYIWLKDAWNAYSDRPDLAGITMQRQSLIPQNPSQQVEIVNDHVVFLYAMVGSIGFSPHPKRWTEFINWIKSINIDVFDVSTPGLITSDWWKKVNKRHMWTQHFIYFCKMRCLYTLYINLPRKETLCAHYRERGEHYPASQGRDFSLALDVARNFPKVQISFKSLI